MKQRKFLLVLAFLPLMVNGKESPAILTLETAIYTAVHRDPWVNGSHFREQALSQEAIASATLPDPRISLTAANFPTDSFDIRHEPMTQLMVGVSQKFPRGESRNLQGRKNRELAEVEPLLRADRQARVSTQVTQLWLDVYKAQESIRLINNDRSLFEHLIDATKASYASTVGRARQQDIIRAQLELTRLDDRLYQLQQTMESVQQRLVEWVGDIGLLPVTTRLTQAAPKQLLSLTPADSQQQRFDNIDAHPALVAFDKRLNAMSTEVELARQHYKPEWGISAQYGYRADDLQGNERSDFLSLGVNFDLPMFTSNRQDKQVAAANARLQALATEKQLVARRMLADLDSALVQLGRLDQRQQLYTKKLLPQMAEQAEASLAAYNNDDGDFAEAIRARISELNAKIDALGIAVARQQILAKLNYLLNPNQYNTEQLSIAADKSWRIQ